MRGYPHQFWNDLSLDSRAKLMARQGYTSALAHDVRVIYQDDSDEPTDVPADGKTVGEIVTRGNIVMKEVSFQNNDFNIIHSFKNKTLIFSSFSESISEIRKQLEPHFVVATSGQEIWPLCTKMEV